MIDSRTSLHGTDRRAGGVLLYGVAALVWTILLGVAVGGAASRAWVGLLWAISAAALWFISLRDREAPLVRTAVVWWLQSLVAPAVVLVELIDRRTPAAHRHAAADRGCARLRAGGRAEASGRAELTSGSCARQESR